MIINTKKGKPEQSKNMTLGSAAPITVIPDSEYVISSVVPIVDAAIIKSQNIKSGISILGVSGAQTVVDTSNTNATAADIASGQTAYVNGVKLTGTAEVPTHFYPSDHQTDGMATLDGRTFYSEVIS